ncbi:MAG: hypothetical protein K2P35_14975 [Lachnospiraceae bacterium]|nr:hypothetical protein [Lachnospiraceae bacterium]
MSIRDSSMTMGGCAYVNSKNWSDMTSEEQEEVRQIFKEERQELEEDFSDDSFAQYILNRVEQVIRFRKGCRKCVK